MSNTTFTADQARRLLEIARLPASGASLSENFAPLADCIAGLIPYTRLCAPATNFARFNSNVGDGGFALPEPVPMPPAPLYYARNYPFREAVQAYIDKFHRFDLVGSEMIHAPNRVFRLSQWFTDAVFDTHPFSADYMTNVLDARYGAVVMVILPAGLAMTLSLWRTKSESDFTDAEVACFEAFVPDIARLAFAGILAEAMRAPSPSSGPEPTAGFVILSKEGELRFADPRAKRIAERVSGPRTLAQALTELARVAGQDAAVIEREQLLPLLGGGWLAVDLHDLNASVGEVVALLRVIPRRGDSAAGLDRFPLTPRERKVAELAVQGLGNREIALKLGLSPTTVKLHLSAVYKKAGVQGRTELAAIALGGRLGYPS